MSFEPIAILLYRLWRFCLRTGFRPCIHRSGNSSQSAGGRIRPGFIPGATPLAAGAIRLGAALLLLHPVLASAQEDVPPPQAEIQELRQELEALRTEVSRLRGAEPEPSEDVGAGSGLTESEREDLRVLMAEIMAAEGIGVAGLQNGRFFIQSPDEQNRLNIGGRIQPRFEYQRRENDDNFSRFRFRRLRVDFRGHVINEDLAFRIMPELRDNARLDTAYVNYRFSDSIQIRAGQYNIPFAWERDVSSSRHQLIERSTANNAFQWPGGGGKDIGLTFHGQPVEGIRYGIGIFGGEGRNLSGESTEGFMFSGRATWSPIGDYPGTETLVEALDGTNVSFGAGAWYANKSAVMDWSPTDPGEQTANASAATLDAHLQHGRFSAHASGFVRHVDVREDGFSSFDGSGFNVQGGYLILPERLFGAVRYSQATPDHDRDEGKIREVVGGLQVFHVGHRSKIHFEAGFAQDHSGEEWLDTEIIRCQYQLLF